MKSLKTFLPAFAAAVAGVALIAMYYLKVPVVHISLLQAIHVKGNDSLDEIFTLLVEGGILLGAASFSWFIFKKKLKESAKFIKTIGKKVYNLHTYFGWAALILVVVHGGYFLITDPTNRNNYTGIAGFLILVCLAVYGLVTKGSKNKSIKKVHFMLTFIWAAAILIHGGSFVLFACGLLVGLYLLLSLKKLKQNQKAA
jgi:cytochrome b561